MADARRSAPAFMPLAGFCISPSLRPSHSVVGCLDHDRHQDGDEGDGLDISAPGAFIPTVSRPAPPGYAGLAGPAHEQHLFRLQRARRSGRAHRNTVTGRAMNIRTPTRASPPLQMYFPIRAKFTWAAEQYKDEHPHDERGGRGMKSSSFSCSPGPPSGNRKASLLPSTIPNTKTAMNPLAWKFSALM